MDSTAPSPNAALRINSGSARSILLTLLGEFVRPEERPVWTATLVRAMAIAEITEKSARQTIARVGASGWITGQRLGRETYWSLTGRGCRIIDDGALRVQSMSRNAQWDGRWLVVAISLPDSYRAERTRLYKALSWAGFGNPLPGTWVTPHTQREDETRRVIEHLALAPFTCAFVGSGSRFGMSDRQLVERAWNLEAVASHYDGLLDQFGRNRPRSGDAVLATHVRLVNAWQRLPFIDPALPIPLLPPHWRGREIAARLEALREHWHDAAHTHWRAMAGVAPVV